MSYEQLKKLKKRDCEKAHFKKRLKSRFNIEINRFEIARILNDIQKGKAVFCHRDSNRISNFYYNLRGHEMVIVYDKKRKMVVSAIPRDKYIPREIRIREII